MERDAEQPVGGEPPPPDWRLRHRPRLVIEIALAYYTASLFCSFGHPLPSDLQQLAGWFMRFPVSWLADWYPGPHLFIFLWLPLNSLFWGYLLAWFFCWWKQRSLNPRPLRSLPRRPQAGLLPFAAGLSVFLCILVLAVWILSYAAPLPWFSRNIGGADWTIESSEGGISVQGIVAHMRWPPGPAGGWTGTQQGFSTQLPGVRLERRRDFVWRRTPGQLPGRPPPPSTPLMPYRSTWFFYLSYWLAFLLAALPLILWLIRVRRWNQAVRLWAGRLCLNCGYDLRASKDRCPECGTLVPERHVTTVGP